MGGEVISLPFGGEDGWGTGLTLGLAQVLPELTSLTTREQTAATATA